jgi:hypothetical protein
MGYFSDLSVSIIELFEDGFSVEDIASKVNQPFEAVKEIVEAYVNDEYDCDPGEMDGDFDSAMASAGYGTDEDYGYYGDEV